MAKRTVSFSDYQEPTWEEYTGEDPPANKWFTGTVKSAKYLAEDDQVMFVIEITDEDSPFKGWGRGWYAHFDGDQKWKMQEIVKAIQGGKTTDVTVDFENQKALDLWIKKAKQIKFQTQLYNERITIRKVRPALELVNGVTGTTKASATIPAVPEPEVADEEAVEDYTAEELNVLAVDELETILTDEFEVADDDMPAEPRRDPNGTKYKKALVEAILEEQEGDEDEDDAEGDDDTTEEGGEEFDDGFDDGAEPEPDPEPEPRAARRSRATKAAPAAAAAPAKAAPAARRRRG